MKKRKTKQALGEKLQIKKVCLCWSVLNLTWQTRPITLQEAYGVNLPGISFQKMILNFENFQPLYFSKIFTFKLLKFIVNVISLIYFCRSLFVLPFSATIHLSCDTMQMLWLGIKKKKITCANWPVHQQMADRTSLSLP